MRIPKKSALFSGNVQMIQRRVFRRILCTKQGTLKDMRTAVMERYLLTIGKYPDFRIPGWNLRKRAEKVIPPVGDMYEGRVKSG